jgi:hypothetical protein
MSQRISLSKWLGFKRSLPLIDGQPELGSVRDSFDPICVYFMRQNEGDKQ